MSLDIVTSLRIEAPVRRPGTSGLGDARGFSLTQPKEPSLKDILDQYLSEPVMQEIFSERPEQTSGAVQRIQSYLAASPIVLFMKGSPAAPQCGFSARVVSALRACRASFTHVDVLDDPDLRRAVKSYSNWPTIPQLYIEGELIGGCDIVVDMFRSGELSRLLQQAGAVLPE
jgi:monothiol glutaredoxin